MSSSAMRKRAATPGRDRDREVSTQRSKRSPEAVRDAVEVVCRLYPYSGPNACLAVANENIVRCIPPPSVVRRDNTPYQEKSYEFGYVFDESDGQKTIFNRCGLDLIEHLVTGRNALLFTYGVTGSGKTYTMTGKPTKDGSGLLPRTLDVIFNSIQNKAEKCIFYPNPNGYNGFLIHNKREAFEERRRLERERMHISTEIESRYNEMAMVNGYNDDYVCAVFVSYVEIYNDCCYDLLEERENLTKRDIRTDQNDMMFVSGATEVEVESSDEALEVFCRGEERRRTGDTLLNKDSSRSHSVFNIRLVMAPYKDSEHVPFPVDDPSAIIVSQLSLVDLAGSERAKRTENTGVRLAEAGKINNSLMTLRQCIDILRKNQKSSVASQKSVPYRDSKLTMLFKNYFEGTGKVRMIICANPKPDDFAENLNVLAFAEESQSVRVARAVERLQASDSNRPPVPRRFYSKWNAEIDQCVVGLENGEVLDNQTPSFNIRGYNDKEAISDLRDFYMRRLESSNQLKEDLASCCLELTSSIRNSLCLSDYRANQIQDLTNLNQQAEERVAQYTAQNKQLQRKVRTLQERLVCYEAADEEARRNEEEIRRSHKEGLQKITKQERVLKEIHDICDGAPIPSPAGHVAQLANLFGSQATTPGREKNTPSSKRVLTTTTSTHAGSSESRRDHSRGRTPANTMTSSATSASGGPGYCNPKFYRRSKSASRVLDHQPLHRVPTGGVLKARLPSNARQTTKPEMHQLQKSSDYVLTHQEVDSEGNISTSIVKGECVPTAGGGTAVLFNDVERVRHESPGTYTRRLRSRGAESTRM